MKIEKLDNYGRGIAYVNDKIYFIKNALPNENIEFSIVKEKKKYGEGITTKIIDQNKARVESKCKYYDKCGGCHLLHMNHEFQKEFKYNKVVEILNKFSSLNLEVSNLVSLDQYNYRNKVVLHIEKDRLGFYKDKTNELIDIENCLLLDQKINNIICLLRNVIKEEQELTKATIKKGNVTNEIMLILEGEILNYKKLLENVDVLIINNKTLTDKDYITSYINNKKYLVSSNSFFQINEDITKLMYDKILDAVRKNNSKKVLDLYCGTGTIGIYISDYVDKIIGIEVVDKAIDDANKNKVLNNCQNISFIKGKVEDKIDLIDENIDTIILDPPRSGLHSNVIKAIDKIKPETIIYVSCDPVTLARDIKLMTNYEVLEVTPFDMFPNTYHVECVCIMKLH